MSSIYFMEPYTGTKISYISVWKKNEFWWKDKNFNLIPMYDGPRDNFQTEEEKELYEDYLDFVDLCVFYKIREDVKETK